MLSGRRLNLLDPSPVDVEINDIARGLSRVARWNGQTEGPWGFTVAQHSVLVESLTLQYKPTLPPEIRLAALLHDASEYVVGDLITPFKAAMGSEYKALEERLNQVIRIRFGLPATLPRTTTALIKRADHAAAFLEATQLAGFSREEARRLFKPPRTLTEPTLTPQPPQEAEAAFLARFHALAPPTKG